MSAKRDWKAAFGEMQAHAADLESRLRAALAASRPDHLRDVAEMVQPAQGVELPPLPPPMPDYPEPGETTFTAAQMRDYARAAIASAPRVSQEDLTQLRGEASVLRGWIAEALPALEIAEAVEDGGEDGGALLALIEAGKKLAAPQPGEAK